MSISSRFARLLAGACLALFCAGHAAIAQIYVEPAPPRHYPAPRYTPVPDTGGYGVVPQRRYHNERSDDYDMRPRRRVPREDYRDYSYEEYPRPRRRAAMGSVCVTSRGECDTGTFVPLGSGCRCRIPGFGSKGGYVRY